MLKKVKWGLLILVTVLVFVIIFRNLEQTSVELIFATVSLPLAALLAATLLIGFALGLAVNAMWKVRSWRASKSKSKPDSSSTSSSQNSQ